MYLCVIIRAYRHEVLRSEDAALIIDITISIIVLRLQYYCSIIISVIVLLIILLVLLVGVLIVLCVLVMDIMCISINISIYMFTLFN